MRTPTRYAAVGTIVLLASLACGRGDTATDTAAATATATAAEPAAPAASALDAMRGRWSVRSVPAQGSDTTSTLATIDATGDTASWTMTLGTSTTPVKLHVVSAAGDSLVVQSEEFDSARRRGMRVSTMMVMRPQGDRLAGMTTARYRTTGADSVLVLRSEGTRAP